MLDIRNLSYRYKTRQQATLKNIDLHLQAGEMLLLAGRSGCGKSTLIKAISGLLGSDGLGELQGSIAFNSKEISHLSPEKIGCFIGTVYQSPDDQIFAMTVADEVGFALENQGLDDYYIDKEVSKVLKLVGLEGFEDYSIFKLSGGQRQRLALASILVTKPQLLVFDEPVSQMNPQGVKDFMELLVCLNQQEGIAVLIIEHRVNELCQYFDRIAIMQEGSILYDGAIEKVWDRLTGKLDMGIREPQNVKLCRALALPVLCNDEEKLLQQIKTLCVIDTNCVDKREDNNINRKLLLTVKNLSYRYPAAKKDTLKNISFQLFQGEIVALMGFNGAGKSTLLNILGSLTQYTEGEVTIVGKNLKAALKNIGYMLQEPDLMLLTDTVKEELLWGNKALSDSELENFLEKLNLKVYADDFPLALSKGQRLRLVLGAMLAKKPQLLLLDEPTSGQDEHSLQMIKELLFDYRDNGGTVFICTHDTELAADIADRIILLKDGRILKEATSNAVLSNDELLVNGGLNASSLLGISRQLHLPPCVKVKEVEQYVSKAGLGGL